MTKERRVRRPNGARAEPTRSVRIGDDIWYKAKRRAELEGHTVSRVLALFIEGYASGLINIPKVQVVYPRPRPDAADQAPEREPATP